MCHLRVARSEPASVPVVRAGRRARWIRHAGDVASRAGRACLVIGVESEVAVGCQEGLQVHLRRAGAGECRAGPRADEAGSSRCRVCDESAGFDEL